MLREIPLSPVCPRVRCHHEREVPHGASPGLGHWLQRASWFLSDRCESALFNLERSPQRDTISPSNRSTNRIPLTTSVSVEPGNVAKNFMPCSGRDREAFCIGNASSVFSNKISPLKKCVTHWHLPRPWACTLSLQHASVKRVLVCHQRRVGLVVKMLISAIQF